MTVKTPGTGRIIKMSKTTFVVATHNPHKLKEFARILEPLEIEIVTLCIFFVLLKNTVASNELVIAIISIILKYIF